MMDREPADPVIRVAAHDEWEDVVRVFGTAMSHHLPSELEGPWRSLLDPDRTFVATTALGVVVGTAASFPTDLTLPGGAAVPVAAVTAVGVLPTHRRRRIGSRLLETQLRQARDDGHAGAVLHASEGGIYGRYGYGAAVIVGEISMRTASTRLRERRERGELRYVTDDEATHLLPRLYEEHRAAVPGEIGRPPAWWELHLADPPSTRGEAGPRTWVCHLVDGEPRGYLGFRVTHRYDEHGVPDGRLEVFDLVGAEPDTRYGLWRFALDHDLVATVHCRSVAEDDPIRWWVRDGRQVREHGRGDGLWLRPLDVPTLLRRRAYLADGSLTVRVIDPLLPEVGGTWRWTVEQASAEVEPTAADPDVTLEVGDLGALLFGAHHVGAAIGSGRVEVRRPAAVRTLTSLLLSDRSAVSRTGF